VNIKTQMVVTDRVYSYHCLGTQFCRDSNNNYLGIWVGDQRLACTEKVRNLSTSRWE